jgi:hypothetical protein
MHSRGGRAAGGGFCRYSTNGRCTKEVSGGNKIVSVPLFRTSVSLEELNTRPKVLTISSGSSGKRVMVPEPSRSIFCFMRRILSWPIRRNDKMARKEGFGGYPKED